MFLLRGICFCKKVYTTFSDTFLSILPFLQWSLSVLMDYMDMRLVILNFS